MDHCVVVTHSVVHLQNLIIIIIISGLHHYECIAPLVANSLQSVCSGPGRLLRSSVHDGPWELRSFCNVFIQVIRGRPSGLFTEGEEVKICLAIYIVIHSGDMPK